MKDKAIAEAWKGPPQCRECGIRDLVLFADLNHDDFELIHQPIDQISYSSGERIYSIGDKPRYIYTLREGMVKLVQYLADGSHRIVRLLKQGDVVGLEATLGEQYKQEAVALEPIEVCRIPVDVIKRLGSGTPRLQQQLLNRWHRALSTAENWLTELSTGTAQARVARLLLRLSDCHNGNAFQLPIREDVGAILGITTETASRTAAEFKRLGLIKESANKRIEIDIDGLKDIAE